MIEENKDAQPAIIAEGENFSSVFRETALQAIDNMPKNGTHKE